MLVQSWILGLNQDGLLVSNTTSSRINNKDQHPAQRVQVDMINIEVIAGLYSNKSDLIFDWQVKEFQS